MTVQIGARKPSPILWTNRPFDRSLASYLWTCLKSARYLPSIARVFLFRLHQSTILGWWWLVIRALLPSLGMIAILQHVPSLKPATVPYGLYVISGMLLWTVINNGLNRGTRAIRQNRTITTKLALPKLILVISSGSITGFYLVVFLVVFMVMGLYHAIVSGEFFVEITWKLLLSPLPLIVTFILAVGIACITSVMFLFARDARFLLSVVTQIWFYFTPVIYGIDILPPVWQSAILYLNPVAPLLEFFRWTLFGVGQWTMTSLAWAIFISFGMFLLGAWFLMRTEWIMREVDR